MKENEITKSDLMRSIQRALIVAVSILLVPFFAMFFTNEVNWSITDFLVMGALIFGTAMLYQQIVKRIQNKKQRFILVVLLISIFILIWIELAVGIISD